MKTNNPEYWNTRYLNNEIGWDLGHISPPIEAYINQLTDKSIKILVPGAGNAYEVEYLHKKGFSNVYLLDWSEKALENFKKRNPDFNPYHLICSNFFEMNQQFDLILEQTFFCAILPSERERYVKQAYDSLTLKGKLVGLLFNIPLNTHQPPYGGSKEAYISLFSDKFSIKIMEEAYNSVKPRAGNELFFIATKIS